ncbi:DUF4912 domain-containing protein [Almyronema epifaneia]|uniref:DUF4912 domain-containing protein n=1 Tax=Almyronema epifaneia S1 TaxID=2991925 RepID=A0ABW6IJF5_9CYAN
MPSFSRFYCVLTLALLTSLAPSWKRLPAVAQQPPAPGDSSPASTPTSSTPAVSEAAAPLQILSAPAVEFLSRPLVQTFEAQANAPETDLAIESPETALQAVLAGEADFAAIARSLTPDEEAQGLEQVPLVREAIAIAVSQSNPFKDDLTLIQFADIVRGDITDWSVLGGPVSSIRLLDRPANSPVREALSRYSVFGPQLLTGANTEVLETEDLDALVQALGTDGITYGLLSELGDREDLRIIAIDGGDPTQAGYPFSLTRTLVYQAPLTPAKQALLTFLATPLAQDTLNAADPQVTVSRPSEPAPAETAADPEDPSAIAPVVEEAAEDPETDEALNIPAEWQAWLDQLPAWLRWAIMPLVLLLVLLGAALKGQKGTTTAETPKLLPPSAATPDEPEAEVRIEIPDEILAGVTTGAAAGSATEDKLTQARLALVEGIRQSELGQYETALNCLHQAIEAADLARLKAAAAGTPAASLVALLAGSLIRRGLVLGKLGRTAEAQESFETALKLEPNALTALKGKANLSQQPASDSFELTPTAEESQSLTAADTVALTGTLPAFPDLSAAAVDLPNAERAPSQALPINWPDPPTPADIKPVLTPGSFSPLEGATAPATTPATDDVPASLQQAIAELPNEAEDLPWQTNVAPSDSARSEMGGVPADLQATIAELPDEAAILPWAKPPAAKLSLASLQTDPTAAIASEPLSAPKPTQPKPVEDGPPEDIWQAVQIMPNHTAWDNQTVSATPPMAAANQVEATAEPEGGASLSFSACDAQWGYVHWDLSAAQRQQIAATNSLIALRLYEVTNWQSHQPLPRDFQQQECYRMARDWYLPIPLSDRDYLVELGYFTPDKRWQMLARSAPVRF